MLTEGDVQRIADTYHAWRGEPGHPRYFDVPGFCGSVTNRQIADVGYLLAPGRHVGAEALDSDDEPLQLKITRLREDLQDGFQRRGILQNEVLAALDRLEVADES